MSRCFPPGKWRALPWQTKRDVVECRISSALSTLSILIHHMKTVEKQDSAGFGRLFSGSAMGSRITQKLRGFADPAIGSRLGFRMFSSRTLKKMKKKVLLERKGTTMA